MSTLYLVLIISRTVHQSQLPFLSDNSDRQTGGQQISFTAVQFSRCLFLQVSMFGYLSSQILSKTHNETPYNYIQYMGHNLYIAVKLLICLLNVPSRSWFFFSPIYGSLRAAVDAMLFIDNGPAEHYLETRKLSGVQWNNLNMPARQNSEKKIAWRKVQIKGTYGGCKQMFQLKM